MSDAERFGPQLDDLHEEQLKAARLTLHVNGRLVRSEPNTPAGRQAIDKAALLASETSEDVRVGPEGADTSGNGAARPSRQRPPQGGSWQTTQGTPTSEHTRLADGSLQPSSASSRPTLAPCCKSVPVPTPTGRIERRHAFDCAMHPGQPIGAVTAQVRDISAGRLARQHRAQTLRTGLDEAIREHPASYVSAETHALIHVGEDAYDCPECSDRRTS